MKKTTNLISFLSVVFLIFSIGPVQGKGLEIYASNIGALALYGDESSHVLWGITGGYPNGAATGADCAIKARMEGESAVLRGNLLPINTTISRFSKMTILGRKLALVKTPGKLIIEEIDEEDLCGMGVSFINSYGKVSPSDALYKTRYFELLVIAHEEALSLYRSGNSKGAVESLTPYMDAYDLSWMDDKRTSAWQATFVNDYAFLLEVEGQQRPAIELLKKVVSAVPGRHVAWLNLGDACWKTKQRNSARQAYNQYLKLVKHDDSSPAFRRATKRALWPD